MRRPRKMILLVRFRESGCWRCHEVPVHFQMSGTCRQRQHSILDWMCVRFSSYTATAEVLMLQTIDATRYRHVHQPGNRTPPCVGFPSWAQRGTHGTADRVDVYRLVCGSIEAARKYRLSSSVANLYHFEGGVPCRCHLFISLPHFLAVDSRTSLLSGILLAF